ncbi:hypothetical protein LZF95_16460 [Algoriphagus sp. AGSA1]|uniref:hypothetical protein n=1 Tax=unclassified Algoriphagus TaxID=2641541 RepID=UPI00177C2C12|nr:MULTISPECIES: hypothetical protein [unclassified Algoriphagus]MCE7056277.1 hypothetical protein [Algoriphagus sp. AGSA1]
MNKSSGRNKFTHSRKHPLAAVKEVSDALMRIEKTTQRLDIAFSRVEALEHTVENAALLFENGVANYLEVITAQGILLQSQLDLSLTLPLTSIGLWEAVGNNL